MEQAPFWSSFLSLWATLTHSETFSDKKIFPTVEVDFKTYYLEQKSGCDGYECSRRKWLLSCVDGARTILVQFPVTLSDSDMIRDCYWQEKFFTSVDVGLRKCKCPPSVSQVPADGGLPTLESFLPILWVDFFLMCLCSHAAIPPENTNWRYIALHGMT